MGAVTTLMKMKRAKMEMSTAFLEAKKAYDVILKKHKEHTVYFDDEKFDEAEKWIETVSNDFVNLIIAVNDYKLFFSLCSEQQNSREPQSLFGSRSV